MDRNKQFFEYPCKKNGQKQTNINRVCAYVCVRTRARACTRLPAHVWVSSLRVYMPVVCSCPCSLCVCVFACLEIPNLLPAWVLVGQPQTDHRKPQTDQPSPLLDCYSVSKRVSSIHHYSKSFNYYLWWDTSARFVSHTQFMSHVESTPFINVHRSGQSTCSLIHVFLPLIRSQPPPIPSLHWCFVGIQGAQATRNSVYGQRKLSRFGCQPESSQSRRHVLIR